MPNDIVLVDAKGRLLVKNWIRRAIGISPGDRLLLRIAEDSFTVEKVPL